MRRLYREKQYFCGDFLEVDIFPVFKKQRGRGKKAKPTTETQQRLNQRNAERKLIRLLNTNFTSRDIRFDLTYDDEHYPDSPEEAQKQCRNFLRRVDYYRKKHGMSKLKYVFVTEIGKTNGRLHHHVVMSGGIDVNELSEIWGRGFTTVKPLKFNEQGIVGIAKYLIKEPILGKRWCASKNLEKPVERDRDGRIARRKVEEWYKSGVDNKAEIERTYEGYSLADIQPYYNEVNSGYYVTVLLYKQPAKKKRGKNKPTAAKER